MFGLGFVEAYGFGVFHHAFQAQVQHGLRGVGHGEEFGGGFVYAFVGGLRGKQDGNQEFEGCGVVQFGLRVRVFGAPAFEHFLAGLFVHCGCAVCCCLRNSQGARGSRFAQRPVRPARA